MPFYFATFAATGDNYRDDQGSQSDDSIGYLKKSEDGGADGYKHFDSFHKKDGDKYGYEKHSAFGKAFKYVDGNIFLNLLRARQK